MNNLKVTKNWLDWFHKEAIEVVTKIDDREFFTETIKGSISGENLNYNTVFNLVDEVINNFSFFEVDHIRLMWSSELEKDGLQSYKQDVNYKNWKERIQIKDYEIENSFGKDFEDSTDLFVNYLLDIDGEQTYLYKFGQSDRVAFYLWYNPKDNLTNFKIDIQLRKALFFVDENFETHLPVEYLINNQNTLSEILTKLNDEISKFCE